MGYTALSTVDLQAGKLVTKGLLENIKNNFDYLYGNAIDIAESGGLIRNGGFEVDADASGQPDNWDIAYHAGGGSTLVTTATTWGNPIHGAKTLAFQKPAGAGNGGGYALSDYFPITTHAVFACDFTIYANTSACHNEAGLYLYDADKTATTNITLYRTTNESIAQRRVHVIAGLYGRSLSAQYGRLMLNCGMTDMASSAVIYLDDVHASDRITPSVIPGYQSSFSTASATMSVCSSAYAISGAAATFAVEIPYTNTTMICDLNCDISFRLETSGLSTSGMVEFGICLGHGTTRGDYTMITAPATATDYNCNLSLRFKSTGGPQSFNVYGRGISNSTSTGAFAVTNTTVLVSKPSPRTALSIINPDV